MDHWAPLFLQRLAAGDMPSTAAKKAGASLKQVRELQESSRAFAEMYSEAISTKVDLIEEAAFERAVNGIAKPLYYKGEPIGEERQYSDPLLSKLLEAYRPETFTPRQNVKQYTAIEVSVRDFTAPPAIACTATVLPPPTLPDDFV